MKKILNVLIMFFVLIVIGTMNLINVKAASTNMLKKLFVTIGSVDTLEYPGYKLLETNINYAVEGVYNATYLEDITDREFYREIEVVSKETLLNKGIKNINLLDEYKYENATILKRTVTDCCNVFVIEIGSDVLLKYEYEDTSYDVKLFDKSVFRFVDLVFNNNNNKLYLIGNLYTDSLDVYLAEYSLNGTLLKEKIIKGNNVDSVRSIELSGNNIFLCGSTTSSNQDFNHTSYLEDSFVLKVDIESFEIVKYLNLGEVGIDSINVSCYKDFLYVVKHYYNSGVPIVKIYKLDDDLNVINYNYLGTTTQVSDIGIKPDSNNFYYFCSVYNQKINDGEMILYRISKDLSVKKIDTYYDPSARGVDLNVVNNEISLLYTSISKDENYPTYIRTITDKTIKFTLDNRIYDNCYFNEIGNLDLIYKETLKSFEYSLVYSKSLGSNMGENIKPIIMCNNNKVEEDKYLSSLYFDENVYGEYNLVFYYKFDFFDLVIRKDIEVPIDINIDNGNTYYEGLVLTFKGIGYLNNNLIKNGYVINDPGLYELKIIGNNNKIICYSFEIVENKSTKELEQYFNHHANINTTEKEVESYLNVTNEPPVNNIIESDYQNNIWYIIIPIVTLLISLSTFTLLGRKIK